MTDYPLHSRFRNRNTGCEIEVLLAIPFARDDGHGGVEWLCRYEVFVDGAGTSASVTGANWLQSLLLAYEAATALVRQDETQWEDDNGVDAYVLLPKLVPYSWGYDFYKKLLDQIIQAEQALNLSIEERRQQRESND